MIDTNNRFIIIFSVSIAILLYGYDLFLNLICLTSISICVFFLTLNTFNNSNSRKWLTDSILQQLSLNFEAEKTSTSTTKNKGSTKSTLFCLDLPWNKLTVSKPLNTALENFVNCLIEDYINQWYKTEISTDNTFLLEIRYQIRYGSANAVKALQKYNLPDIIQFELLPLIVLHVNRVSKLLDSIDEGTVSIDDQLGNAFTEDLHVAMSSVENAELYLSEIADHLVVYLLDDSRISGRELDADYKNVNLRNISNWPSETCRHFLRQLVLSTILTPILEFITNPDTLNKLVILALEPEQGELEDLSNEERVPFLENLSKHGQSDIPDSLLVLKLSDLIRDSRLLQIFDSYLRDINGPAHYLDCFLQANDCLHRLQAIKDDTSKEFNEVFSDTWQLFSGFVHKSAKTQIELFSQHLSDSFDQAIQNRSHFGLVKSVEEVYTILYHEINYNYVVPFCQSESYLGYLCGTSAGAEELFQLDYNKSEIGTGTNQSAGLLITQIPSKIWNVLRGEDSNDQPTAEKDVEIKYEEKVEDSQIDDEMKSIENIDSSFLEVDDFAFDQSINMNQWKVSIPLVERRRRFGTGKIYFVYIVTIERHEEVQAQCCSLTGRQDGNSSKKNPVRKKKPIEFEESDDEEYEMDREIEEYESMFQLPKSWSIARTYDEFYVFDRFLRQHFGNAQPFALLPDRKMMCSRSQAFLESQRQHMEAFLNKLVGQSSLRHSELFFAFLTNPGKYGFESSLIANEDFKPENTINRRRQEVESSEGEYLKPFISRLLAKALTQDDTYIGNVLEEPNKFETNSLDSGTYSLYPASENDYDHSAFSKFLPNNPHLSKQSYETGNIRVEALEKFNLYRKNITSLTAYLVSLILTPHRYLKTTLLTTIEMFSNTLNRLFGRELKGVLDRVLDETILLQIVKALHQVVFNEQQEEITEESVRERSKQAEAYLKDWLLPDSLDKLSKKNAEYTRLGLHKIFKCFQNPTFNRQLAFVLVDKLIEHILPSDDPDQILNKLHLEIERSQL